MYTSEKGLTIPAACCRVFKDSKIKFQNEGVLFYLSNPEKKSYVRIEPDKCPAIPDSFQRCDGLVFLPNPTAAECEIYIEQKRGGAVMDAVRQLASSIQHLSTCQRKPLRKKAFAVTGSQPPKARTDLQKAKVEFKLNYACVLKRTKHQAEEPL